MEYYQKNVEETLKDLNTDRETGLSTEEVKKRQERYGINELKKEKKKTLFQMFLDQFKDFLVIILLVAAIISIITGILSHEGLVDGIIIMAIVIINAVLGVTQEQKANNALEALKKMSSPQARVLRDGKLTEVPSTDLTIGDIVHLETGDFVAADMRLLETTNLKIDESALTGESQPVGKDAENVYEEEVVLAERKNLAYMSTLVSYGKAYGVVTDIGMETEIGQIATMLESVEEGKTPLQKTIDEFAKMLGIICIVVSVAVFGIGLIQGKDIFEIFLTAIALAVAAIPEGLTAVITVVLALGMQRMVKRNAIIKNLSTVETLGQATVICSDKTGTLTQNEMTVKKVYGIDNEYDVDGTGYEIKGDILHDGETAEIKGNLEKIALISLLCNDASIENENKVLGDPTEGALIVLAKKAGFKNEAKLKKYPQLNEYSFDSTRKMMTSINKVDGENLVLTKGAPDQLIKKCDRISKNGTVKKITDQDIDDVLKKNEDYTSDAFRVLGFAYKKTDTPDSADEEQDLIFVGLAAMIDPPREEAKVAIDTCKRAGIRVMMITGDHLTTAKAIAKELGIMKEGHMAFSGEETSKMSDEEFEEAILKCDVFARSTPKEKIRIVKVLQKHGEVVAMTGDGVNDSPALKQAEIGVAMGITGTEVSKEASNMILTDDNFASIVNAVEEGRTIYQNIRKFTVYLVSCNLGEIMVILFAMIFAFFMEAWTIIPLLAIHLLWINLMTDSFPAFALGMEEPEPNIMKKKPRDTDEKLLDKQTLLKVFIQGLGLAVAALVSFQLGFIVADQGLPAENIQRQARTMIFVTIVFGELWRSFSARSESKFLHQMNPFSNTFLNYAIFVSMGLLMALVYIPPVADVFRIEALSAIELILAAALGLVPMLAGESTKLFYKPV